jgi:toxin HigB-1
VAWLRCAQHATLGQVIKSIRQKGLRRFYQTGSPSGLHADHRDKLRFQLAALETATTIEDMDIPGFRLHPLKGQRTGTWAIKVSGNWRLTFQIDGGHIHDLDYEDYH